ncbi:hypothetical protein K469DRAFT_2081 [Zopfia rhizophila CBS 207.26]|uniref:Uncharacterized protein n=1 Tax=Zopfia rhizophila CBS 207.26 TaxID=1314779 RepID=A0A6A6EXY5_9PEZI|nr:hypothetical protein K469DRAFT_2081 [Zopfia rhizophila CBS 207.26]
MMKPIRIRKLKERKLVVKLVLVPNLLIQATETTVTTGSLPHREKSSNTRLLSRHTLNLRHWIVIILIIHLRALIRRSRHSLGRGSRHTCPPIRSFRGLRILRGLMSRRSMERAIAIEQTQATNYHQPQTSGNSISSINLKTPIIILMLLPETAKRTARVYGPGSNESYLLPAKTRSSTLNRCTKGRIIIPAMIITTLMIIASKTSERCPLCRALALPIRCLLLSVTWDHRTTGLATAVIITASTILSMTRPKKRKRAATTTTTTTMMMRATMETVMRTRTRRRPAPAPARTTITIATTRTTKATGMRSDRGFPHPSAAIQPRSVLHSFMPNNIAVPLHLCTSLTGALHISAISISLSHTPNVASVVPESQP